MERTDENQDFTQTESAAHEVANRHEVWERDVPAWRAWLAEEQPPLQKESRQWRVFYVARPPRNRVTNQWSLQTTPIQTAQYLDISIAWSEYTGERRWSAKQTTSSSCGAAISIGSRIFQGVPLNDGTLSISFWRIHPQSLGRSGADPRVFRRFRISDAGWTPATSCTGCQGDLETRSTYLTPQNGRLGIVMPDATAQDYMRFEQQAAPPGLVLNAGNYLPLNVRVLGDLLIQKFRKPIKLLGKTPAISSGDSRLSRFRLLYPHQLPQFVAQAPFCYQDNRRDYFVTPALSLRLLDRDGLSFFNTQTLLLFYFEPLFHPYACTFVKTLRRGGIGALLSPDVQRLSRRFVFGPGGPVGT